MSPFLIWFHGEAGTTVRLKLLFLERYSIGSWQSLAFWFMWSDVGPTHSRTLAVFIFFNFEVVWLCFVNILPKGGKTCIA